MVEPAPESQAETQEVGGGSGITLSPQPEQSANTKSTMPQPQQSETSEPAQASADQVSQSELECIVPKPRYDGLRHAMDDSENLIYITFDKSGTFMRARPDTCHS